MVGEFVCSSLRVWKVLVKEVVFLMEVCAFRVWIDKYAKFFDVTLYRSTLVFEVPLLCLKS